MEGTGIDLVHKIFTIINGIASISLAIYVFVYQLKRDRKNEQKAQEQRAVNNRIELFNKLFLFPNFEMIEKYFKLVESINKRLTEEHNITDNDKNQMITEINSETENLRYVFLDKLKYIEEDFHKELDQILTDLQDQMAETIYPSSEQKDDISGVIYGSKTKFLKAIYSHIPKIQQ